MIRSLIKSSLLLGLAFTAPARAATCYSTKVPSGATAHITFRWPEQSRELGEIAVKIGRKTSSSVVSCLNAQPVTCQIDGDLGSFTLIPDGSSVNLIVRDGRLDLRKDDGGDLEAGVVRDASTTTYELVRREASTCVKRFGAPSLLTFP